jgi:signal transduction histidine kinase
VRASLRVAPQADRLPPDRRYAILRIVQESLGNVHRHAKAAKVSISVRWMKGHAHLLIRDDGEGIGSEAAQLLGERLGLGAAIPGTRVRVRQMGGQGDGKGGANGTAIHVAIPIQTATNDAIPETAAPADRADPY